MLNSMQLLGLSSITKVNFHIILLSSIRCDFHQHADSPSSWETMKAHQ
jgi:hypothetical protein